MGLNSNREQLYEPGFFTTDPKSGKQVLAGYKLNFSRNGDTYTLTGVNKPDGNSALTNYSSDNGSIICLICGNLCVDFILFFL